MSETEKNITGLFLIISFLLGALFGVWVMNSKWKYDTIKHNAAHYDSKTAEFKWNDEVGK